MQRLFSLVNSLSSSEKRIIIRSLSAYSSRKDTNTKFLQLFEKIVSYQDDPPSKEELSNHVYGVPDDPRFKMLKSRLKSKILDAINLDVNIDQNIMFDSLEKGKIKVKKKLAQFVFTYSSKGANHPIIKKLANEVITLGKTYEDYSSLIEVLNHKKYIRSLCGTTEEFNRINADIKFYTRCYKSHSRAVDAYYRLVMNTTLNTPLSEQEITSTLSEEIKILRGEYQYTQSAILGYFLKLLEITFFEKTRNYIAAINSCVELLSIIKMNKSVYKKGRLGIVYINLAEFYIASKNFSKGLLHALEAATFTITNSHNYLLCKDREFLALFHSGKTIEAKTLLKEVLRMRGTQTDDFRFDKFNYFQAIILFKQGEYKLLLKELNKNFMISKDKRGWDIHIRIMTIITLIEVERFDIASTKIESLRKHIERNLDKTEKDTRERVILKILYALDRTGFHFDQLTDRAKKLILSLQEDETLQWEPLSSELIRFDHWVVGKLKTPVIEEVLA